MKTVQLKQGSPEWHAFRAEGIGSSDAPVIEGSSPYRTKLQLYREKVGEKVEAEEGKEYIFAKGHQTEVAIRKHFQELTGVFMEPLCLMHPEFPHVRASLDGFDSKLGVLEAKLTGQAVLEAARGGEIPRHHWVQMQHQFAVSGADIGQWFGHDGKKNGVLVDVKADPEFIKRLLDDEHAFWDLVKKKISPAPGDNDFIRIDNDPDLEELKSLFEHRSNLGDAYNDVDLAYEELKERIVARYKHAKIEYGPMRLWKVEKPGNLNLKAVPEVKQVLETLGADYIEKFRGNSSVSWRGTLAGRRKKESA